MQGKGSGLFYRPSPWSSGRFEPRTNDTASRPLIITERQSTTGAVPQRCGFTFCLHLIHSRTPVSWQRRIIRNRQPESFIARLAASLSGTPMPVIRHGLHGINWQAHSFPCFCDHTHLRRIVFWRFKNRQPIHSSIQNVEHFNCPTIGFCACHRRTQTRGDQTQRDRTPFTQGATKRKNT